ncbi:WD repeat-containing protein 82 [Porphyridium purpureum]|uniref:WD repeat-containing protein 82 n=1 Tax=Porphyridium purpureum TaxID=35688 RepID=A0A5J4YZV7_PORPP|nr:WD repeat-containing protein 82 [Porphyridium purpureum]|eukprot:POR6457..scf208_2
MVMDTQSRVAALRRAKTIPVMEIAKAGSQKEILASSSAGGGGAGGALVHDHRTHAPGTGSGRASALTSPWTQSLGSTFGNDRDGVKSVEPAPAAQMSSSNELMQLLEFSPDGGELLTGSMSSELLACVANIKGPRINVRTYPVKKYGVGPSIFAPSSGAHMVIHASNNAFDHSLRHLSLSDSRYVRYYRAHRDYVTSIAAVPRSHAFVSAAMDASVRFWDQRTSTCQGRIALFRLGEVAQIASDGVGVCLLVCTGSNSTLNPFHFESEFFDMRMYDRGPFLRRATNVPGLSRKAATRVESIYMSDDASRLLVGLRELAQSSVDEKALRTALPRTSLTVLDGLSLNILHHLRASSSEEMPSEPAHTLVAQSSHISPDGVVASCGTLGGQVCFWDVNSGRLLRTMEAHKSLVTSTRFHPSMNLFASVSSELHVWRVA